MSELRRTAEGLRVGDRMPSSRLLAADLGVGPVTLQRAVARLVSEGVLTTRPGDGTFVARPMRRPAGRTDWQQVALGASPVDTAGLDTILRAAEETDLIPFSGGYPDVTLRPDGRIASALTRAARRPGVWGRPPIRGIPELRSWFGTEVGVEPERVLIAPGGQAALSATMRALVPAGSPVLFAVPTYPGALAVARSAGLVPVPVPVDRLGVLPDLLERAFQATNSRLLYLQPTFANPDGHVLAADRRADVLSLADRAGAFIIEDDWARWLAHGSPAPPPLIRDDQDGHVVLINSLTKVAAPSLRIGSICAYGPVLERIAAMRLVDDFFISRPMQETAVELVTSGGWQSHIRSLAVSLRQRCEVLTGAITKYLPEASFDVPRGGVNVWIHLPGQWDDVAICRHAAARGVGMVPGRIFTIGETEHCHFRLSYGGVEAEFLIEAVRRLADAVRDSLGAPRLALSQ